MSLATRVGRADTPAVAAKRKAEFEAQLAMIYSFDSDQTWKEAHKMAQTAVQQAQEMIPVRNRELAIPLAFAPTLSMTGTVAERTEYGRA